MYSSIHRHVTRNVLEYWTDGGRKSLDHRIFNPTGSSKMILRIVQMDAKAYLMDDITVDSIDVNFVNSLVKRSFIAVGERSSALGWATGEHS